MEEELILIGLKLKQENLIMILLEKQEKMVVALILRGQKKKLENLIIILLVKLETMVEELILLGLKEKLVNLIMKQLEEWKVQDVTKKQELVHSYYY